MKNIPLRVALIVLIIIALWIHSTLPAYASPGEAAQQYWARVKQNDPYLIGDFEILDDRYLEDARLVIAKFSQNTGEESIHNISYAMINNGLFVWYIRRGQSIGKSPLPDLVLYAMDRKDGEGLIYGQIISTNIAAVQVLFENGETLSDAVTNGSFAILFLGSWQFDELRVLDRQGKILQRYNQPSSLD